MTEVPPGPAFTVVPGAVTEVAPPGATPTVVPGAVTDTPGPPPPGVAGQEPALLALGMLHEFSLCGRL